MESVLILEEGPNSGGAYVPDLPGCVVVGETREETLAIIRQAIEFHIEGMKEDGEPISVPHSHSEIIEVNAALPISLDCATGGLNNYPRGLDSRYRF